VLVQRMFENACVVDAPVVSPQSVHITRNATPSTVLCERVCNRLARRTHDTRHSNHLPVRGSCRPSHTCDYRFSYQLRRHESSSSSAGSCFGREGHNAHQCSCAEDVHTWFKEWGQNLSSHGGNATGQGCQSAAADARNWTSQTEHPQVPHVPCAAAGQRVYTLAGSGTTQESSC
jgi:hypothetical protein